MTHAQEARKPKLSETGRYLANRMFRAGTRSQQLFNEAHAAGLNTEKGQELLQAGRALRGWADLILAGLFRNLS